MSNVDVPTNIAFDRKYKIFERTRKMLFHRTKFACFKCISCVIKIVLTSSPEIYLPVSLAVGRESGIGGFLLIFFIETLEAFWF